jgi:aminoglycoside 3'-phosphotransferase-2
MRLPSAIAALVKDGDFERIDIGCSRASVFRITGPGRPTVFLKSAPVTLAARGLIHEAERLQWLDGKLPVPRLLSFSVEHDWEHLLMTGVPGLNGVDAGRDDPHAIVVGLAEALRHWHAQSVAGCPFDETLELRIERAREQVRAGLVDESDFDDERRGRTASSLLIDLEGLPPIGESRVLTHGDPCLPNVMFEGARVTGFVDCDRAGVADPYQDLALASRSIAGNLGHEWVDMFFRKYGLPIPDQRKLSFYRLLDEFF